MESAASGKTPARRRLSFAWNVAKIVLIAAAIAAIVAAMAFRLYFTQHLTGSDGMFAGEVASALEAKYGGTAKAEPYPSDAGLGTGSASIISPIESITRYKVDVRLADGTELQGSSFVRINGLGHELMGDDLQEEEIVEAAAREIVELAGIPDKAYLGSFGFLGSTDNPLWGAAGAASKELFDGHDALAFIGERNATIDIAYLCGTSSPEEMPDMSDCPNVRVGLLGVNELFGGNVRTLRESLSTEGVARTVNETMGTHIDPSDYEGVYEWSPVLARPDCIDDLDEFENGEWKRRHPSRTAYLFGSERFEHDFAKVDEGLRFFGSIEGEGDENCELTVLCGPYEYRGEGKGEIAILFNRAEALRWFEQCEKPYMHWDYDGPSEGKYSYEDSPFELQASDFGVEVYKTNLSLADSFVIANGKVSWVQAS